MSRLIPTLALRMVVGIGCSLMGATSCGTAETTPLRSQDCPKEKPQRWWEGFWCSNDRREPNSLAAFQLSGDEVSLAEEGNHPGSEIFLFGGRRESLVEVIWYELPGTFRMRYYMPTSEAKSPRFSYEDACSLEGLIESEQIGQGVSVFFTKTDGVNGCPAIEE